MDQENIGEERFGGPILPPERTDEALRGCGAAFVTGTTLVNDTIHPFLEVTQPIIFYGVTIAGAAKILGFKRYCARGL